MGVVDASLVVAALNEREADHAISLAWWLSAVGAGAALHAPAIVLPEATAGARRILGDHAAAADTVARWLAASGVTLWPVTSSLAGSAAQIVGSHGVRGCDAVYLALAAQLEEPLVTLDRRQLGRGAAVVETTRPS